MIEILRALMLRELGALRREVEAYPDERAIWATPPGISNSAGSLTLHLAGNLQHFLGARLADTGYVRDREAEFSRRHVSRAELLRELDAALVAVEAGFRRLSDEDLEKPYPEQLRGATVPIGEWLGHLAVHLGYHLGQIDYHRRLVTREGKTVDTIAMGELPSIAAKG